MILSSQTCRNRRRLFGFLWKVECGRRLPFGRRKECPACGHLTFLAQGDLEARNDTLARTLNTLRTVPGAPNPFVAQASKEEPSAQRTGS